MGDAKIYSALISGFNATTTNPTTAGWTTITGTTLAGQDATHYFIIDNGEERIILDSTPVVLGQAGCNVYTFAAGVWQFSYVCNNLGAFTVSNIDTNNGKQVRVRVNVVTNISTPQTAQYTITMNRDVPIADFFVTGRTGNPQVADFNFLCSRNSSGLPFSKTIYALGGQATDIYGFTGTPTLIDVDGPMVVPVPSQGQDLIIGLNKSTGSTVNVTGSGVILVPGGAPPFHMYLGYTPRTYTPHSTINTLIGNSDGQFIEADYYNAWEGVTPFVAATNLLTNGTFETDTTGWTNNGGTWARVTTQKKFGTASVQGSSANGVFSQQVSGLTVGAKYSASAWVRTVDATAGNAAITFGTAATSGTVGTTPTLTFGKEWSLLTAIWTATQTSIFIRLSIDVSGVGNFQFDGVTMYTVVDSSGNKKLSFQTTDATQWAVGTNASGITTLTSPRGSGIQFTTSAQFGNIKTDFQSQDFSRYRYVNLWAKRISGSGDLNLFFRTAAGASTGQTGTTIPSMTTLWQFFTLDFGTQQSNAGWTSAGNIYIESANAAGTFAIANISVSQRNMSAGNKHGLINDFEETAPLAWWKLDELSGSGSELLTNPGFETYTTTPGIPDSWINNGLPSTNDAEKETTIKRSGSNSVKITINDNDGGTDGIAQDFSVTNGSSYYIEAWVQTGGAYVAKLLLTGHGGGGTITSATGGNSSAFSKLSMTFKATATGTARLYLVDAVNATGHIFYWDDISIKSITAGDASGNGGNGILSGAANTAGPTINATGKINTGYDFDGVDDYILATIPSLNPSITGASLEAWLKPSTVAAGVAVASNFQGSTLPYIGRSGAAATLSWFDSAAVQQSISGGTLTAGQYSHVVATLAGTTVTLFINGVQVAQNTATTLRNLASVSYALGGA